MTNWTKEQTMELIVLYEGEPILYNILGEDYTNRKKKEEAFVRIKNNIIAIRPDTSVKDIKVKIKTLRTQYKMEKTNMIKSKKSGAGTGDVYCPKLWCYDSLLFLDEFSDHVPSRSNIDFLEVL